MNVRVLRFEFMLRWEGQSLMKASKFSETKGDVNITFSKGNTNHVILLQRILRLCLGKLFFFYTRIYSSCQLDEGMHLSATCFPRLAISLHCPRLSNHGVAERGAIPAEQKLPRWKNLSSVLSQMTVELSSWNVIHAHEYRYIIYTHRVSKMYHHWSCSFSQMI